MELCKISLPKGLDGHSFATLLNNPDNPKWTDAAYGLYHLILPSLYRRFTNSAMRSYALAICIFTVFFTDSQNISDFPVLQFIGERTRRKTSLHFGGKESIACWTSLPIFHPLSLFLEFGNICHP